MTDEQQPDVRWAPIEPKPRNRGRVWLIVGLVIAALVIVGVLLFFLLPRGENPAPEGTSSPTPTATSSPTPTPTNEPEPTMTPITTPPPPADPTVDAFRGQVQGWLDDAVTGLDIVSTSSGQDAMSVVNTLEDDAQRLAETSAPSSIQTEWIDGVSTYADRLSRLRSALSGGDSAAAVDSARSALDALRSLVGL